MLQKLKLFICKNNKKSFLKNGYYDIRFLTYTYFKRLKTDYYPAVKKNYGLILEIGCGSGIFINTTDNIIGIDINFTTLKNIKRNKIKQLLVQADARKLPFKNDIFDFVASFGVLEHINEPQMVLNEIYRVNKGESLITVQINDRIPFIYDPVNSIMKKLFNRKIDGYGTYGLGHCSVYNTEKWLYLLSTSGFKEVKVLSTNRKTSFFECLEYNLFSPFTYRRKYEDISVRLISSKIINLFYILYNLIEKVDFTVFKTDKIIKCFEFRK